MNQFYLELQLVKTLNQIFESGQRIQKRLLQIICDKAQSLSIKVPEELRKKLSPANEDFDFGKSYDCRHCGKSFKDGRQLGGHTSRKHKSKIKYIQKKHKNNINMNIKAEVKRERTQRSLKAAKRQQQSAYSQDSINNLMGIQKNPTNKQPKKCPGRPRKKIPERICQQSSKSMPNKDRSQNSLRMVEGQEEQDEQYQNQQVDDESYNIEDLQVYEDSETNSANPYQFK